MRIGLVALHTSPGETPGQGDAGGLNVVVFEAAQALAKRGHDVAIITRATDGVAAGSVTSVTDSVSLVAIEAGASGLAKLELVDVLDQCSTQIARLDPFDLLHSHYWLSGLATAPAANIFQIPHVATLHTVAAQKNANLSPGDTPEPDVRLEGERLLTRTATVVASSTSELSGIIDGYGAPPLKAHVVHPGVDTELFEPREKRQGRYRVTVLGRVQPLKGQDLAVRAIASLAKSDPAFAGRIELIIAGEPTPGAEEYAASLRELAEHISPAEVTFLPAQTREEAAELLSTSHLALIPSLSETFGLVALEAAASGTPTVASHTTGLIESVLGGVSGVHVNSRDPSEWAATIQRLLTDDEHREALSRSARAHAFTHSWDAHAASLEQVYKSLIDRSATENT